jgi:hypothetical protein
MLLLSRGANILYAYVNLQGLIREYCKKLGECMYFTPHHYATTAEMEVDCNDLADA